MKTKPDDVLIRIHERYSLLSKGQKRLSDYILEHYEKAVYMTAARLGECCEVSESTVVRFAKELGYDGYPEMQRAMEELIRTRLTALQRMEVSQSRMDKDHLLGSVLASDIEHIKETISIADQDVFDRAVEKILKAKTVYILGARSSSPLSIYLGYYLMLFFDDVRVVGTNTSSGTLEQLFKVGPEDVVIGISFPRYSKQTVKAMDFAKNRGASVIAITDNDQSPIVPFSDYVLKAYSDMISFVDSLVGPMSLINALIVALSMHRQEKVEGILSELETIWTEYDVYESQDEDAVKKSLS